MRVYINDHFFEQLQLIYEEGVSDLFSSKAGSIKAVVELLSSLPLHIDLDEEILLKYLNENDIGQSFTSIRKLILKVAVRNQHLNQWQNFTEIPTDLNSYYFLSNHDGEDLTRKKGIVAKDVEYDGNSFYDYLTVADLEIEKDLSVLEDLIPPCNAMLIIDRYLFGPPFERKLKGLTEFITLFKSDLQIPFHLSILIASEDRNGRITTIKNDIDKAFQKLSSIPNIELELLVDNKISEHDRLIMTNYTSINIGKPFDGTKTKFNQKFLGRSNGNQSITDNYRDHRSKLREWQNFINLVPQQMGLQKTRWQTSKFKNRIFEILD
jgi:hypothetical protein